MTALTLAVAADRALAAHPRTVDLAPPKPGRPPLLRELPAALLALLVVACAVALPGGLEASGRAALAVTALAVIGWTLSDLPDVTVAILAAVAMVAGGALPGAALEASLAHPMIWLMLSAFVVAGALTASGVAERVSLAATRRFATVRGLFYGVAGVIVATAFAIPSTSGRAALLLPVFLVLAERLPDPRLTRPLALMFPTVILLSAGGSLIGAGAHVVAADAIAKATGQPIGVLEWSALALPFALATSLLAVELILRLFAPAEARAKRLARATTPCAPFTRAQTMVCLAVAGTVALWVTMPWHGLPAPAVALIGAAAVLSKSLSGMKTKDAFRKVDVELLVFLAATMSLAKGMSATGADTWLAARLLEVTPAAVTESRVLIVLMVAGVATAFHLLVNSRTARTAVLIPALGVPLAGLGHDMALLVLVIALGTGFCQTLPASAKPVALFASIEQDGFRSSDLLKLAAVLGPLVLALLVLFAVLVWPEQLAALRGDTTPIPHDFF